MLYSNLMSMETIQVEELDGGLRAAFVNLPHFRTHSARLVVYAGSSHETPDAYGGAHFLEHITFQGTEGMPEEQAVHEYSEHHGLRRNAFTSMTHTNYVADGYELEPVGYFVSQAALHPILGDNALEEERSPIIDEIRGYASSPGYAPNVAHSRAMRGDLFARPIAGSIDDVRAITGESLRAFYERHYKLANALLVISSAAPIEEQREFALSLVADELPGAAPAQSQIDYGAFNPEGLTASLQPIELPYTAQTKVSIAYDLPESLTHQEQLGYGVVGMVLSKMAFLKLRREMALCYGANAGVARVTDQNFGRQASWAHMYVEAGLNGEDALTGLQALYYDVLHAPLDKSVLESLLIGFRREVDHVLEGSPSGVADNVVNALTYTRRDTLELDALAKFADTVTLADLERLRRNVTDTKPLVLATSPDPTILQAVGDWADTLNLH